MREHKHDLKCPMPYALEDLAEGCWAVAQDGQAIVLGDSTSVRVIYNNLTGRNYQARGHRRTYLAYMSGVCGVTIRPEALSLVEGAGK